MKCAGCRRYPVVDVIVIVLVKLSPLANAELGLTDAFKITGTPQSYSGRIMNNARTAKKRPKMQLSTTCLSMRRQSGKTI